MEKLWHHAARTGRGALAVAMAAAILPLAAAAQDDGLVSSEQEQRNELGARSSGWDVALGAGAAGAPKYEGSKHYKLVPLPFVAIRYDDLLSIGIDGIRLNVIHSDGLRIGPLLGYGGGRKSSDDDTLRNLDDIQASLNAGVFATYRLGHFQLLAQAQQAVVHQHNGLSGKLGLNYQRAFPLFGKKAALDLGPVVDFADRQYEDTWFGITPLESAQSGLPQYSPSGGIKDVGLQSSLTFHYSPHVLLRGIANIKELTGGAADSPITTGRTQYFLGLGVGYRF